MCYFGSEPRFHENQKRIWEPEYAGGKHHTLNDSTGSKLSMTRRNWLYLYKNQNQKQFKTVYAIKKRIVGYTLLLKETSSIEHVWFRGYS